MAKGIGIKKGKKLLIIPVRKMLDLKVAISVQFLLKTLYHFFLQPDGDQVHEVCEVFKCLEMSSHAFFLLALVNVGLNLPFITCFRCSTYSASISTSSSQQFLPRFSLGTHGG